MQGLLLVVPGGAGWIFSVLSQINDQRNDQRKQTVNPNPTLAPVKSLDPVPVQLESGSAGQSGRTDQAIETRSIFFV